MSRFDRAALAAHAGLVAVLLVVGLGAADDPGWADLQRVAVLVLAGIWTAGIAAAGLAARRVPSAAWRRAVVVVGPLAGFGVFAAWSALG